MSRRALSRGLAVVVAALALLVLTPAAASAHPLGNFTVNRYSGLVIGTGAVTVDHVLDLAEIPTAQRAPSIDTDHDGTLAPTELDSWAAGQCRTSSLQIQVTVDGRRLPLVVGRAAASTAPGQAGLPILRLECGLRAPASVSGRTSVGFADTGAGGQVGWREVTARGDGVTVVRSDVPRRSTSARLTSYPKDLLRSPLDVRGAHLTVRPGGAALRPQRDLGGSATVPGGVTGSFQDLATRYDGSPLIAVTALLAALVLGAGHAVAPGHGKTIMAFYLSGRREGALRAAGTVGATVTATHTAGVLALGLLVSAGTGFVPARVYPWLTVVSGVLVVAVGVTLLRSPRSGHVHGPGGHTHDHQHPPAAHRHAHPSASGPSGSQVSGALVAPAALTASGGPVAVLEADHGPHPHDHGRPHDHGHPHAHGHPHDQPRPERPSRRGLVAMGLAGGLLPSPSAVLVFLGALAVGHPWFGVLLVVAFGTGMATTLAVVGVLVIRLRERVERRLRGRAGAGVARVLRVLPVLTALAVITLGAVVAARGAAALG